MGIHAADNLSHLVHDPTEPYVPDHYDYDDYVIREWMGTGRNGYFKQVGGAYKYWEDARTDFIRMFAEHRKVKLIGRVYN